MDVRAARTKTRIMNAFLDLLQSKPVERITVQKLCELAGINKSTFYKYFASIYDVSAQLEKDIMKDALSILPDPSRVFREPESCVEFAMKIQASLAALVRKLPQAYWMQLLPKLHKAFRARFFECNPAYRDNLYVNMFLAYAIFGGYYAYHENPGFDSKALCAAIGEITAYLSLGIRNRGSLETGASASDET